MKKRICNSRAGAAFFTAMLFALTTGCAGGQPADSAGTAESSAAASQPSMTASTAESGFAGGDGSAEAPYQIADAAQLALVNQHLEDDFVLTADVDLSGYENWTPLGTFQPVSASPEDAETPKTELSFTGSFDGDGHTISNVTVLQPETYGVGFFGCVGGGEDPAKIYDLTVENVEVTGNWLVGGVVGYQYENCTLENIAVTGTNTITGSSGLGGLVGGGVSDITGCSAAANVVVTGDNGGSAGVLGGGLVGCTLTDCTAVGSVDADGANCFGLGGLAGALQEGKAVKNCSADATIDLGENGTMAGGLLGYTGTYDENAKTAVENCNAKVTLTAADSASRLGGIIGGGFYLEAYKDLRPVPSMYEMENCTTDGSITGGKDVGTIAGYAYRSDVTDCESTLSVAGQTNAEQIGLAEE